MLSIKAITLIKQKRNVRNLPGVAVVEPGHLKPWKLAKEVAVASKALFNFPVILVCIQTT
jgi:hypothetical protein